MGDSKNRNKLRQSRYDAGLCVYCGKKEYTNGKQGCTDCLKSNSVHNKEYSSKNKHRIRAYHIKIRYNVIKKYGGCCACCGEENFEFLTIDHINNDGGEERKAKYGSQSGASYSWFLELNRTDVGDDLQVLCFNCNMAKAIYGICPHNHNYKPVDLSILDIDNRRKSKYGTGCKIKWPPDDVLINMINKYNCESVARVLRVHGTAIRGRLKRRNKYDRIGNKSGKRTQKINKKDVQVILSESR